MSTFLKVAIGLLLTLPLCAYIAGTLVASQADMPGARPAVVISGTPSDAATPRPSPAPSPTRSPDDHDDDHDDDDDDPVRVLRPTPRDVDERQDRLEDRRDERQDRLDDRADEREDRLDDRSDDDGADDD